MRSDLMAEGSVLGAIMMRPEKMQAAAKHILGPDYFYSNQNRIIWNALTRMIAGGEPIDATTLNYRLFSEISREEISLDYLLKLTDQVPSPEVCETYAKIVAEEYRARMLETKACMLIDEIREKKNDTAKESWENFYGSTSGIFLENQTAEVPSIVTLTMELDSIKPDTGWGTPWGIPELDQTFGEIAPGAIVVIGGRPGHCKTALALQLIDGWLGRGKRVLFHSLEMTWRELNMRRLSRLTRIPAWRIKRGYAYHTNAKDQMFAPDIQRASEWIFEKEKFLTIKDQSGVTPQQVALSVRMEHDLRGLDFLVLDHFHLLSHEGNKEERFLRDEGLRTIVTACKQRKITPVILAQLNRSIESEGRTEPKLSDLREVGSLEEMATNVLFTFWEHKVSHKDSDLHNLSIFQLKARDGVTGKTDVYIDPEIYRIGGYQNGEV